MSIDNPGTGVDITIGEHVYFSQVGDYSASEEVTALDPADSQAAFGQLTVQIADEDIVASYDDLPVQLVDGQQGSTLGHVRGLSGNSTSATVTADSGIGQTAVTRQVPPHNGTLASAITEWLAACGITENVIIDSALGATSVVLPGWSGVVYDQLKKLAVAYSFEMALVSGNIVFRPLRTRISVNLRDADVTWGRDSTNFAQTVEGYYYNTQWLTSGLAYPGLSGWNSDVQVFSVGAGETKEIEVEIDASLSSIDQPECVEFVDRLHSTSSVYAVAGNDGLPIQPAQWAAGGGKLEVTIGKDTRTLIIKITGSAEAEYAPYDIAVSAGPSDMYPSLRIVGTGAFMRKETLTLPAHQDPDRAPQELGATVENEFYGTASHLFGGLLWTSAHFASPKRSINVTTKGINRIGVSGVATALPSFGQVMALYPGATLGEMSTTLGPTFGDAVATLYEVTKDNFENQAFGNVAGSRVRHKDCWYRIRSATITATQVTYGAEWDVVLGDMQTSETMGDWNARWAGKTFGDVANAPLTGI